jgi:AcrR family transcriptional regulator
MKYDTQDKKAAIIRAALKLFTERGFHGTPTSMISQEAGVATGTLFRYFATKEDLINYTYLQAKSHMAAAIKDGLSEERTLEGKARRIWGNAIRWGLRNQEEFLFIEQFASSPYITRLTEEEAMSSFGFLIDVLDEGVRQGKIQDAHCGLLLEMIYDSNKAVAKKIMQHELYNEADALIDRSFELLWGGIGKS